MATHHLHLDPVRQFEIKFLVPDQSIVLVQLVKLALLEEQHRVEVILLDLPKLFLKRRERCPSTFGYHDGPFIIIWMIGSFAVFIPDIFGF